LHHTHTSLLHHTHTHTHAYIPRTIPSQQIRSPAPGPSHPCAKVTASNRRLGNQGNTISHTVLEITSKGNRNKETSVPPNEAHIHASEGNLAGELSVPCSIAATSAAQPLRKFYGSFLFTSRSLPKRHQRIWATSARKHMPLFYPKQGHCLKNSLP
jgi:hypothetical protein